MININTDHQYFCTTMTLCKHRVVPVPASHINILFACLELFRCQVSMMLFGV